MKPPVETGASMPTIYPGAIQHIISVNETPHGMAHYRGLILHIMQGTLAGTDNWFHNPKANASSTFGIGKLGQVIQFVHLNDKAWAEAYGNPDFWSVECEGKTGDSLTPKQIAGIAKLYHFLEGIAHFGYANISDPALKGLGHHSMGGVLWGNHPQCPGAPIIAQKPLILAQAQAIK